MKRDLSVFSFAALIIASIGLLFLPHANAREDEVKSAEKLNLLKAATGGSSASSTYQARLDAILNTTPTPARTIVANQDAQEALFTVEPEPIEEEAGPKISGNVTEDEKEKKAEEQEPSGPVKSQMDMGEKNYQKQLDETYKQIDEDRAKQKEASTKIETPEPTEEEKKTAKSKQPPSLANNPFYFTPDDQKQFEEDKPIIISRLVQAGLSEQDADAVVSSASTPEEVIITLMQENDYTFAEATDVVRGS